MKERVLTGSMIFLVLVFAFLARELSLYVFDAFVIFMCIIGAYETSKLLAYMGYFNSNLFAMIYPILSYTVLLITILTNTTLIFAILWQFVLIIALMVINFAIQILAKKTTNNEIKTRKYKESRTKFAVMKTLHTVFAMVYPTALLMSLVLLNRISGIGIVTLTIDNPNLLGLVALLFAFLIPILTDTFSMLTGTVIGGKKLCPKISPNKTVAGAVGGVVFSVLIMLCLYFFFGAFGVFEELFFEIGFKFWHVLILTIIGSVICNFGDLFESLLKRKAKVKDSGTLLPGHGGMLDRIDSHVANAPWVLLFFVLLLII